MSSIETVAVPDLDGLEGLDGAGLLALAGRVIDRLGAAVLDGAVGDAVLRESVVALHRLETVVHAEKLRRIAEVGDRQAWLGHGLSAGDWLATRLGLTRGEARTLTEAAAALRRLPATAAKLRAGDIGPGQVVEAARGLGDLDRLAAGAHHAGDAGDRVDGAGGGDGAGGVDGDGAEGRVAALDTMVAAEAPGSDRRQTRQRVQDLTGRLAPEVVAARERRARARRHAWLSDPQTHPDGLQHLDAWLDPLNAAPARAALDALSVRRGPDDDRSLAQRRADAIGDMGRLALDALDRDGPARPRTHVIVLAPAGALDDQPGRPDAPAAELDGHGPLSPASARQLACDADHTPVTLGPNRAVLDVGRRSRHPTRPLRSAVIARDRRCIGCGAPASRCEIHHIIHWTDGGHTRIDNLVLVCWACHTGIHHHRWTVTRTVDGSYTIHRDRDQDKRHSS